MTETRQRLVLREPLTAVHGVDATPTWNPQQWDHVREYVGDDTYEWTPWEFLYTYVDRERWVTAASSIRRVGLFAAVVDRYCTTHPLVTVERRHLVHSWVDPHHGRCVEVVDTEERTTRT